MVRLSIFFAILFFPISAIAQQVPEVKYDRNGVMVEVGNISDVQGCFPVDKPYTGTIVRKFYEEDELTVAGIILSDSRGERIGLNMDSDRLREMSMADMSNFFGEFIRNGKRVMVWTYACGAGGRVEVVTRIRSAPRRSRR